jgi:hypothetical protein
MITTPAPIPTVGVPCLAASFARPRIDAHQTENAPAVKQATDSARSQRLTQIMLVFTRTGYIRSMPG